MFRSLKIVFTNELPLATKNVGIKHRILLLLFVIYVSETAVFPVGITKILGIAAETVSSFSEYQGHQSFCLLVFFCVTTFVYMNMM